MTNPFAGVGVPDGNGTEISNLVDQAVVLQSALVPKLPEIGVTDGMIPIIDQIYADSGSSSIFVPGTTINFNFGNSHGKLVDWTQSRLEFDLHVQLNIENMAANINMPGSTEKYKSNKIGGSKKQEDKLPDQSVNPNAGQSTGLFFEENGIFMGLRHGAQVFSQITFGGAGRPITMNDYEMTALAQSLLTTAEGNVKCHIGDITTIDHHGCGTYLHNNENIKNTGIVAGATETDHYVIHVSIPLTTVMPMFGTVDNYLLSTTSGIELRLTITNQKDIFVFTSNQETRFSLDSVTNAQGIGKKAIALLERTAKHLIGLKDKEFIKPTHPYYNRLVRNGTPCPSQSLGTEEESTIKLSAQIKELRNVHIDLISTQHPDDYILNMLNGICATRGLFYPNQMHMCTPFNMTISPSKSQTHHSILVPVVSGWRNIDSVFCWWTRSDDYTQLVKMPMINVYTSLNGTFKTPVHSYRDKIWQPMTEQAAQFNRAFGTINSKVVSPMKDIMEEYLPLPISSMLVKNEEPKDDDARETIIMCEASQSHSHICNSTIWELEKSSWMNGPDFSQHANKYQIVFDLLPIPEGFHDKYTLWVCQRFDSYTHVYNGYINILTTKEEVAMALAQAQAGQSMTA